MRRLWQQLIQLVALLFCNLILSGCHLKQSGLALGRLDDRLFRAKGNEVDVKLKIRGFRNAEWAREKTGIFMEARYDPAKTPVLLIHGLMDDPDTWMPMVRGLRADPRIREHYQFLFYAYPSGTPTAPAAAILKRHLDAAVREIEVTHGISLHRKLIVLGHSMGGILAKSLISESGDHLWDTAFTAPPERFDLTLAQRELLVESFRYSPRRYVRKAIFLATPHRGSRLASGIAGRIGTALSARPRAVEELSAALLANNRSLLQPRFAKFLSRKVNSVATLRPDSPVTTVMADMPVDPAVEFHSVAGVRNRCFRRGDGVVSLESTFVKGAYCEVGIFSRHGVHREKEAVDLVKMLFLTDFGAMSDEEVLTNLSRRDLAFVRYRGINYY